MKTNVALLLIGTLLLISSCGNKKAAQITEESIPVIDLEYAFDHLSGDQVNFSEFAKDITYIPMETNEKSIFGGKHAPIYNITEKHIFAGDMMFRRDGRFVRQLGKKGQGPGEYLLALGMAVDEEREEFYVNDNFHREIFIYDFNNNFKKKVKGHPRGSAIKLLGNGKIMLFSDSYGFFDDYFEYKIIDTNTEEIVYTRTPFGLKETDPLGGLVWNYNHRMFYYESFKDTIYSLIDGEVSEPTYLINQGKYKCPEKKSSADTFNPENYIRIGQIVECDRFLFFSLRLHNNLYYAAYDKTNREVKLNEFSKFFNNDIDGGFLWLYKEASDGQEGFYYVFPYLAKERIEGLSSQNKKYDRTKNEKLRQFIDSLDEDNNEILYFFDLE
ncbi:MAG: 6-bladed beta-propeller [Dysgonamonadaceae bacterium]|jgi:hypothetical protein|nr:6-bladed beta-propeller [Dysgonamonadaceae bacterium]